MTGYSVLNGFIILWYNELQMDLEIDAMFWKKYSCRITVKLDWIYVSTVTIFTAILQC